MSRVFKKSISERMLDSRIIYLDGEINDDLATNITAALLYLNAENRKKDITMYINSPGGSISSGYAIRDVMNFIDCDVKTICIGMAASMASFLLASGTKGKRYILPDAEVMIHQPLGGTQGQASDIIIHAEHIKMLRDKMVRQYSEMTGQEQSKILADIDRDHYLSSQEAKEYGLVDHVIASIADCGTSDIARGKLSDDDYDSILEDDEDED